MPEYAYTAQNTSGRFVSGKADGKDQDEVIQDLRGKGLYPIDVKEVSLLNKDIKFGGFSKVTMRDLSVFCRQFSTVISAGITITDSLDIMRQQTENAMLKSIVNTMFEEVQKGRSLSSVMREHREFPVLFVNMIEAGEASGRLEEVLQKMAAYYEKEYRLKSKIKSAMTYPIVISVVALAVVIFMINNILPTFTGMIVSGGGKIPAPTRILLGLSHFNSHYWYIILLAVVLIVYFYRNYAKTDQGRYRIDGFKLKMPIFGKLNNKIVTSRFSSTLAVLLGSGIPVIQAMDIVEKTITNAVVERGLEKCKEDIKKGAGISKPIESMGVFPPMLIEMISIGEESGRIDDMLQKTSDFYDQEVDIAVGSLTSLIEPIIIVVLGFVVGFIVVSMVMPMFDMYQYVGK